MQVVYQLPAQPQTLVEMFRHYFGTDIDQISSKDLNALPHDQQWDLSHKLDIFLESAATYNFAPEAVMIDALFGPTMFKGVTRRTKRNIRQLTLYHPQIIIPLPPFDRVQGNLSNDFCWSPASLLNWAKSNRLLLEHGIYAVCRPKTLFDFSWLELNTIIDALLEKDGDCAVENGTFSKRLQNFAKYRNPKERREIIANWMFQSLSNVVQANCLGTNLAFANTTSSLVYSQMMDTLNQQAQRPISRSQTLISVNLPMVDDIADEDFVELRLKSDDFLEFRLALGELLKNTAADFTDGTSIKETYKDNLARIAERSNTLTREVEKKSSKSFLRDKAQSATVKTTLSISCTLISNLIHSDPIKVLAAVPLGISAVQDMLAAVLQYHPPEREQRLLRFYNVLLDKAGPQ